MCVVQLQAGCILRFEQLLQSLLFGCVTRHSMARLLICDHMLGVCPDLMLVSVQELTLNNPNIVNAKKNTELTYGKGTFLSNHQ